VAKINFERKKQTMRVSELQKQLTDHLAKYGDDYVLVGLRSELESVGQSFKVGPANDKDGSRFALLGVAPWFLLDDKSSAGESSENAERPTNSLQQAIQSLRSENEKLLRELPAAIRRIAALLKDGESPDPEKEETEEAESALEKFLKEITSSGGPVNIQIRVTL